MKIAMLLDPAGRAISPEQDGTVYIYERHGAEWAVVRSRSYQAAQVTTIAEMRDHINQTCEWLGDCTILTGLRPRGFAGLAFAQSGVEYWTVGEGAHNYLDQIAAARQRQLVPSM